ncbi:putative palmitoyl acyltransferase 9 [Leptomonas pyrrhocoris]|uniref:Palmitoyltransferase n=1 Tax=Leptomonas pyrrhocoris TaxID=157538 RepID=A0A0M9G9D4_LEPPY|nr:putative palmitoyl acyltransferase 9 [Leptomonas pyrrhocoris]KPA85550.1 putative palmitoyl acyltransferase 9 [Leptomonas pyrrhocoris]|eukprot:XP_015663989.1 putative palmitoyl acyltransferase 9 [Leptomonas pyrrhocoris]
MNALVGSGTMMSSYWRGNDTPSAPSSSGGTGAAPPPSNTRVPVKDQRKPKPKPKELFFPVVDPQLYRHRYNTSKEARGTFRLIHVCGIDLYLSTDFWIGVIPMGITVVLIVANMALVWEEIGWREYIFTLFVLATTFTSYFLTTTADPGIYPRLRSDERDPLEGNMELVFCKQCRLRRPPRCSHCYHCDVCVLEHDHHCTVLGGCVGVRNLRWFTLYLLSCCSSTMIGVVWLSRSLYFDLYADDSTTRTVTPYPTYPGGRRRFEDGMSGAEGRTGKHLLEILILMLDCLVVMLVGAMLFIYIYLTLTDTTRRESLRKQNSIKALLHPTVVWKNMLKAAHPPPSLLTSDGQRYEEMMRLV